MIIGNGVAIQRHSVCVVRNRQFCCWKVRSVRGECGCLRFSVYADFFHSWKRNADISPFSLFSQALGTMFYFPESLIFLKPSFSVLNKPVVDADQELGSISLHLEYCRAVFVMSQPNFRGVAQILFFRSYEPSLFLLCSSSLLFDYYLAAIHSFG